MPSNVGLNLHSRATPEIARQDDMWVLIGVIWCAALARVITERNRPKLFGILGLLPGPVASAQPWFVSGGT